MNALIESRDTLVSEIDGINYRLRDAEVCVRRQVVVCLLSFLLGIV